MESKNKVESEKSGIDAVAGLKAKGMTIYELTKPEEEAWRVVQEKPVLDYFLAKTGKDGEELVRYIQAQEAGK